MDQSSAKLNDHGICSLKPDKTGNKSIPSAHWIAKTALKTRLAPGDSTKEF